MRNTRSLKTYATREVNELNWNKTQDYYVKAGATYNESPDEKRFAEWKRRVTDKTGNYRISKEDGTPRPERIVKSIIRIRKDSEMGEGYITSKQTLVGLDGFGDEVPISVDNSEYYWVPNFHSKTVQENRELDERISGEGKKECVFIKSYADNGKEYMDELYSLANPRKVKFYVCEIGRKNTVLSIRNYEDLRDKSFEDLINPKEAETALGKQRKSRAKESEILV